MNTHNHAKVLISKIQLATGEHKRTSLAVQKAKALVRLYALATGIALSIIGYTIWTAVQAYQATPWYVFW